MSDVRIRTVRTTQDERVFLRLPWRIYDRTSAWVPPLMADRRKLIDRKGNPFYRHAAMEMFLAERDGVPTGRIAAIVNDNHNREHGENIGFFGFFETINDQAVAAALFDAAAAWLRGRGVTAMRGPASPSVNDEYGMLINAFDIPPAIMMSYNPPYYPELTERYGFRKMKDLYAYRVEKDRVLTDKLVRVAEIVKKRDGVVFRSLRMKQIDEDIAIIHRLYSEGWERNWGEVPMTAEEFDYAAVDLKKIVDPELVIIAEVRGEPAGFALSLPDLNIALKHNRGGYLIPGVIRLLLHRKKIDFMRIIILGVLPKYLNSGIGGALFYETARRGVARGYPQGEASWVLEDNVMMNRGAELMQAERYKTYRVYQKELG